MAQGWLQIAVFLVVLTALVPLLGGYIAKVFQGERVFLSPVARAGRAPLPTGCCGCGPTTGRTGRPTRARSSSSACSPGSLLYLILRTQEIQPFNPEGFGSGPWNLSFNTASSFVTNTNWQYYGGETTLSYFAQMAGLAVQNFVSAAVGIAVLAAVIRGFAGAQRRLARQLLGRPGPDHPLRPAADLVRRRAGARLPGRDPDPRRLASFPHDRRRQQTLALGPVASQEAIKELGTNGGGFFNVNSAFPFENPNGLTNIVELLLILVIPASLTYDLRPHGRQPPPGLGALRGDDGDVRRRGRGRLRRRAARQPRPAPRRRRHPRLRRLDRRQHGGQGGQRNGIAQSSLWTAVTTVTSCGAVNAAFDSLTGIGGLVPLANMLDRRGDLRRGRLRASTGC